MSYYQKITDALGRKKSFRSANVIITEGHGKIPTNVTVAIIGGIITASTGAYILMHGHCFDVQQYLVQSTVRGKVRVAQRVPTSFMPLINKVDQDLREKKVGIEYTTYDKSKSTYRIVTPLDEAITRERVGKTVFSSEAATAGRTARGVDVAADELAANKVELDRDSAFFIPRLLLYLSQGYEAHHAGHRGLRSGSVLGLPRHFTYRDVNDVPDSEFAQFPTRDITHLILSPAAQKFCVARELCYLAVPPSYIFLHIFVMSAAIFIPLICMFIGRGVSLVKVIASVVPPCCYPAANGHLNHFLAHRMDALAASVNVEYLRGGVEYYEKQVERERALGGAGAATDDIVNPQFVQTRWMRIKRWVYYRGNPTAEDRLQRLKDILTARETASSELKHDETISE